MIYGLKPNWVGGSKVFQFLSYLKYVLWRWSRANCADVGVKTSIANGGLEHAWVKISFLINWAHFSVFSKDVCFALLCRRFRTARRTEMASAVNLLSRANFKVPWKASSKIWDRSSSLPLQICSASASKKRLSSFKGIDKMWGRYELTLKLGNPSI